MKKLYLHNNFFPALLWAGFHLVVPRWHFDFLGGLLLLRALVVFTLLLARHAPVKTSSKSQSIVAWTSTFLPALLVWQPVSSANAYFGQVIAIFGTALFIFTSLDLGRSFGISPAVRPRVTSGIYKFISDPMYFSHVIIEMGLLVISPNSINVFITVVAWVLYLVRAEWESKLHRSVAIA